MGIRIRKQSGINHTARRGFTLLELVVAVVILAIIAVVALPSFFSMQNNAKYQAQALALSNLAKEAQAVATSNGRALPNAADVTAAAADVQTIAAAAGLFAASALTISITTSSSFAASSGPGNISVDVSSATSVGLAMTTSMGGCVMALLTATGTSTNWWYTNTLGTNCNGTQALSGRGQANPGTGSAPPAPTSLVATGQNGAIALSWTASTITCGSFNSPSYTVYQAASGSGPWTTPAGTQPSGTATSVTVTGLTNGTTYYFAAVAATTCGNSSISNVANAYPYTVPGQPTGFAATGGTGQASLSWTAPANTGGSAVTGYTVTSSPVVTPPAGCTNTTNLSCTFTGLSAGTTYTFSLVATNAAGPSAPAVTASATTNSAPDAPTSVSATYLPTSTVYSTNSANISWTAPSSNGGSAISFYTVTQSPGGQTCTTSGTSCVISSGITNGSSTNFPGASGLVAGNTYTYTVTATNAVGTGAASSGGSITTEPSQLWGVLGTTTCTTTALVSPNGVYTAIPANVFIANRPQVINNTTNNTSTIGTSGTLSASDQFCINGSTGDVYVYNPNTAVKVWDGGTSWSGHGSLGGIKVMMEDNGLASIYMQNSSYTAWINVWPLGTITVP